MLAVFTKTFSNNEQRTRYFELYMDSLTRNTKYFYHFAYDDCSTDAKMKLLLEKQRFAKLEKNEINRGVELQTKKVFEDMAKLSLTDSRIKFYFHSDSDYVFAKDWFEETIKSADENSLAVYTPFRREDGNERKIGDFLDYVEVESFIGGAILIPRSVMQIIYTRMDEIAKVLQHRDWDYQLSRKIRSWGIPILATQKSQVNHIGFVGENQPFTTTNYVGDMPFELLEEYNKLTKK